jgi:hypothetical protein
MVTRNSLKGYVQQKIRVRSLKPWIFGFVRLPNDFGNPGGEF